MRALSLDLRGFGASHALPSPATGRTASLSVLFHGLGIAALIAAPVLQETPSPETANNSSGFVVQPNILPPPPLPRAGVRKATAASSRPRPAANRISLADPPRNALVILSNGPDPAVDLPSLGDPEGSVVPGNPGAGDCPPGALCGDSGPIGEPTPREVPRVGGLIKEPSLLAGEAPQYPSLALAAGASGRVILEALVGRDGLVVDCRILEGNRLFDDAAVRSVRSRRYAPLLLNGVPTDFLVTVKVRFSLRR